MDSRKNFLIGLFVPLFAFWFPALTRDMPDYLSIFENFSDLVFSGSIFRLFLFVMLVHVVVQFVGAKFILGNDQQLQLLKGNKLSLKINVATAAFFLLIGLMFGGSGLGLGPGA